MSADSRKAQAALAYAERYGFAVFPCRPRGKEPLTANGCKDATTDPHQIRAWWSGWPDANVAIATGASSGIIVLDVDPRHGGDESFAALGELPPAPLVRTGGGGFHGYFSHPGSIIRNSAGLIGRGLDVRGDGGYVIAPPSIHPSGHLYRWDPARRIDNLTLPIPPRWLAFPPNSTPRESPLGRTRKTPHVAANSSIDFIQIAGGIAEGARDRELFRLACSLRRRGYSRNFVEDVVLDAAGRCTPPFPQHLAIRKVASAWRYAS